MKDNGESGARLAEREPPPAARKPARWPLLIPSMIFGVAVAVTAFWVGTLLWVAYDIVQAVFQHFNHGAAAFTYPGPPF